MPAMVTSEASGNVFCKPWSKTKPWHPALFDLNNTVKNVEGEKKILKMDGSHLLAANECILANLLMDPQGQCNLEFLKYLCLPIISHRASLLCWFRQKPSAGLPPGPLLPCMRVNGRKSCEAGSLVKSFVMPYIHPKSPGCARGSRENSAVSEEKYFLQYNIKSSLPIWAGLHSFN